MQYEIKPLTSAQADEIDARLDEYDLTHIKYRMTGEISVGAFCGGRPVGGVNACMTAYKILYISTVFVDEDRRGAGIGRALMREVERRALDLGANMIRLDTFDWQGAEFYRKLGYEQIGCYSNDEDGFSEYFFVKKLQNVIK